MRSSPSRTRCRGAPAHHRLTGDLYEVILERHHRASTIVTSNRAIENPVAGSYGAKHNSRSSAQLVAADARPKGFEPPTLRFEACDPHSEKTQINHKVV